MLVMKNIHDETFKQLMNHHHFAVAFLKQYLPETLKQIIDWETLHLLKLSGDHIEEKTGTHSFSDLIFEIKSFSNKTLWIHIEHQTRSERFMPLRITQYQSSALSSYIQNNKKIKNIPTIITIIFYQGKRRYAHRLDFKNIFFDPEIGIQYFGKPILVDLAALPDEVIEQHNVIGPVELLLKHIRSKDIDHKYRELIAALQPLEDNVRAILLRYVTQATDIAASELVKLVREYLPKDEDIIMTPANQWRQEGVQQGIQSGTYMVARNMLQEGYDPQAVKKVTHLSDQEIQKLRDSEKEI